MMCFLFWKYLHNFYNLRNNRTQISKKGELMVEIELNSKIHFFPYRNLHSNIKLNNMSSFRKYPYNFYNLRNIVDKISKKGKFQIEIELNSKIRSFFYRLINILNHIT